MSSTDQQWRAQLVGDLEGDILEIGFGSGSNLPYYRRAASLQAIEPDAGSLKNARRAVAEHAAQGQLAFPVEVQTGRAEALPFDDARFDVVVSSLVFCSVENPRAALAEIRRVLKPGGALHMVEHVRPQSALGGAAADLATPFWKRLAHNCHLNRPTLETLRAEGWQVTEVRRKFVFRHVIARP